MSNLIICRPFRFFPLASILVTSCITNKLQVSNQSCNFHRLQHQKAIQKITVYKTSGIFSWISNRRKIYAHFHWQQNESSCYRLLLSNALGGTEIQIDANDSFVQLTDKKGKRYISNNAEKILEKIAGINIPLVNLRQWILGLPGDVTDFTLDNYCRLKTMRYRNSNQIWNIRIKSYDNRIKPALPSSIEIEQGEKKIKLRMHTWILQ